MTTTSQNKAAILSMGMYVPPKVVKNTDLEKLMDTSDEWIKQRSGIEARRYVEENVSTSDLAYEASIKALKKAEMKPEDIDMIIVSTLSLRTTSSLVVQLYYRQNSALRLLRQWI